MLRQQFPHTNVLTFDSFREKGGFIREGYLRDQAKEIIKQLRLTVSIQVLKALPCKLTQIQV